MEAVLLVIILIVLLIRWLVLSGRLDNLEHRIEALGGEMQESPRIAALTARVYALEQALKGVAAEPAVVPEPAPQPVAEPVTAAAIEVIETPPVMPPPLPPEKRRPRGRRWPVRRSGGFRSPLRQPGARPGRLLR